MSRLYRVHTEQKKLHSIKEINYADHDFKERYDIQEWVASTPRILGEELMIIAKEKTAFEGTKERPDLIAIDKNGCIVIIELKRDDSGTDVHWQAIKYASYWSRFTLEDILNVYKNYLVTYDEDIATEVSDDVVYDRILDFIDEDDLNSINHKQRILLASHVFSREVVSAAKWLIDEYKMDLKCVQLIPYYDSDLGVYSIISNVLLPLPEIEDYLIKPRTQSTQIVAQKGSYKKVDEVTDFVEDIRDSLKSSTELLYKPNQNSRWACTDPKFRYYHFWYTNGYWSNWGMSYRIWRYNDKASDGYKNKYVVMLVLDKGKLLAEGMTSNQQEKIWTLFSKYDDSDFGFYEDHAVMELSKFYDTNELSENMKSNITYDLIKLINNTKKVIDDICNE